MQEEKEKTPAGSTVDDATSSETLSDIEEKENVSEETADNESSGPLSPDGSIDSDKSERSPKDDIGPM